MATITRDRLTELQGEMASRVRTVTYDRLRADAALQAIEDWFEANRAALGTVIETAAPTAFTAAEKRLLVAGWLRAKLRMETGG